MLAPLCPGCRRCCPLLLSSGTGADGAVVEHERDRADLPRTHESVQSPEAVR